ncbi:hypothetical protein, partial [Priestia megaterium]|uniref:hypothetical protein n=1 Tax=Priestia megaterium TaxID=1404 RepID=UPI0035B5ADFB
LGPQTMRKATTACMESSSEPSERLLGALLARARALGLACQRGQPAPLDAAPIVETLDWLTHPDRFKPRSGITFWGPSRLAVD